MGIFVRRLVRLLSATPGIRLRGIVLLMRAVLRYRLEWNSHLWEVDWKEDWLLAAVVRAEDLYFFAGYDALSHVCCAMIELVVVAAVCLAEQMGIVLVASFQFSQELVVPLCSHDNLAVDVLNVQVFTSVASMRSHERGLVGHAVDVVRHSSKSRLLKRRCRVSICHRLLDGVE